ncbi:hypothetical protein [Citricoccus sp. I39-566]|uniref:hypothetical protein n=1 Tax=Citricoccus sp. I39-566 TaxID=3073268 RepID=UPI00286CFBE2|nr:hypothetical protein [Citricoccus sp. I39-566]WMY79709.1 hypothetical protein RE421_07655 [Citricoccus sp. I39-566]
MDDSAQQLAPWWFSGTIGLVGVVVGLLLKMLFDWLSSRAARQREDRLRFIQDKRVAYAELLAACTEAADIEHENRLLAKRKREFDSKTPTDEDVDDYNRELDNIDARRTRAYQSLNSVSAVVDLIGPDDVVEAAGLYISRCHHPHLLPKRVDAEAAYVDAVRRDLGYGPTSHLRSFEYEPLIKADDQDSGV